MKNPFFSHSFILILGILLGIFLFKTCSPQPATVTSRTIDSLIVERIIPGDTIIKTVFKPYPVTVYRAPEALADSNLCDSIRNYSIVHEDSLMKITANDSVVGMSLGMMLEIEHKPRIVFDTTIIITDSIPYAVNVTNSGFYGNAGIGINASGVKTVLVGASFVSKKKWSALYQYDISRSTHNATIGWKLFK